MLTRFRHRIAPALLLVLVACGPTAPMYDHLWIGIWDNVESYVCGRSFEGDIRCWSPDSLPFSRIPGADVDVTYRAFDIESDLACGITGDGVPTCWGFEGASTLADTTLDSLVAVVSQVNAVTWIAADGRAERLRVGRSASSGPPFELTREAFSWFDVEPPAGGADLQCDTGTCWGAGEWAALSPGEYAQVTVAAYRAYWILGLGNMVCGLRPDASGECTTTHEGVLEHRWTFEGPLSMINAGGDAASLPTVLDEDGRRLHINGARYEDKERYVSAVQV